MKNSEKIDYIIGQFNFKAVHEYLKHKRAKIKLPDGQEVIPTVDNLIVLATYCLQEVVLNGQQYFSFSGFEAYSQEGVFELSYPIARANTLGRIFN